MPRKKSRKPAAKRRKNAAHVVSRGSAPRRGSAPAGRKKTIPRSRSGEIRLIPIIVENEFHSGEDVADKLLEALQRDGHQLQPGDILVINHKIISKAEGQLIDLATITPSAESVTWSKQYDLDPRVIELALRESRSVIRRKNGVLITETRHGFICANSGFDLLNEDGGRPAL